MPEAEQPPLKNNVPKPFETLSAPQKVRAILAGSKEPIIRTFALDLAGINLDQLKEPEKEAVNEMFGDPDIQRSMHEKFGERYWVPSEKQVETFQKLGIDQKTVSR